MSSFAHSAVLVYAGLSPNGQPIPTNYLGGDSADDFHHQRVQPQSTALLYELLNPVICILAGASWQPQSSSLVSLSNGQSHHREDITFPEQTVVSYQGGAAAVGGAIMDSISVGKGCS